MYSITRSYEDSYQDRGSKFLGYLNYVANVTDFEEMLTSIKQTYPDATHHCYAYRTGPEQPEEVANDDGEPGGTAGQPILNELKSNDLINVGLVVVRYFGGTKLGKPGLINAYRTTARHCIEKAKIVRLKTVRTITITYDYSLQKYIDRLIHKFDLGIDDQSYAERVTLHGFAEDTHTSELKGVLESYQQQLQDQHLDFSINEKTYRTS